MKISIAWLLCEYLPLSRDTPRDRPPLPVNRRQESIFSPRKTGIRPPPNLEQIKERKRNRIQGTTSLDDPRLLLLLSCVPFFLNRKFIERGAARETSEAHRDSSSGSVWLARAGSSTGPPRYDFPPFELWGKRKKVGFSVCDPSRSSSWIDFAITCRRKTRNLVPVPSFPSCAVRGKLWHEVLEGNGRNRPADLDASLDEWSWRGSWLGFSRAIVRSTSDGRRWLCELVWFIVPGFISIYSLDLYICMYFVLGVIDLSIHKGMWDLEGSILE